MRISRRAAADIGVLVLVNGMGAAQYAIYKVATEKMGLITVRAWMSARHLFSIYLLPYLGVLNSALTRKERITPAMIVGGLITLAGTILITSFEPTSSRALPALSCEASGKVATACGTAALRSHGGK